jgi:hypothetical protein
MTNSMPFRLLYVLSLYSSMLRPPRTSQSSYDPLSGPLQPPENETEEEKALRLEAAREAVRVSRTIDASLAESKKAMDRKKRAVKILLLGPCAAAPRLSMCSEVVELPLQVNRNRGRSDSSYSLMAFRSACAFAEFRATKSVYLDRQLR